MEGTLERKHKLQLGGKKVSERTGLFLNTYMSHLTHRTVPLIPGLISGLQAASRAWSSHHAVLYRHSLCFYQDRKDTLRVSRARGGVMGGATGTSWVGGGHHVAREVERVGW